MRAHDDIPIDDISKIVEYLYHDEEKDYFGDDADQSDHIFLSVRDVAKWLDKIERSSEHV
jgi:hypothetical protein